MFASRSLELPNDEVFVVAMHVEAAYEGDAPWARCAGLDAYRARWDAQRPEFLQALRTSLSDPRTVAEIWTDDGEAVGLLWMTFHEVTGWGCCVAEIRDVAVARTHRRRGLGRAMVSRAVEAARAAGAKAIRADVGAGNEPSLSLHRSALLAPSRTTLEGELPG